MRKILICILGCTFFIVAEACSQDTINWSPSCKLKWEDFQGVADSTTEYGAISNSVIKCKCSNTEKSFTCNVYSYFDKKKSWVVVHSKEGLIHEQGHFDINEIFARKLRILIKAYKLNAATVNEDMRKMYTQIINERALMNSLYDKETNFHLDNPNQIIWSKKIELLLNQFNAFK